MEVLEGKSSINGPFSMATLNNQRVNLVETSLYLTQKDVVRMEKHPFVSGYYIRPTFVD
jgi:hypothetical protein